MSCCEILDGLLLLYDWFVLLQYINSIFRHCRCFCCSLVTDSVSPLTHGISRLVLPPLQKVMPQLFCSQSQLLLIPYDWFLRTVHPTVRPARGEIPAPIFQRYMVSCSLISFSRLFSYYQVVQIYSSLMYAYKFLPPCWFFYFCFLIDVSRNNNWSNCLKS